MNNNNITSKRTPLRNSNLANRPFRSPFSSESSPLGNNNLKKYPPSPCLKTTTPKRQLPVPQHLAKRRRIDVESCDGADVIDLTKIDLLALKQRVRQKRQEVESLKIKLASRKKHKKEDLRVEINKWQLACQKALIKYHKDCIENFSESSKLTMSQLISILGISNDVIKFPKDDFD